MLKFLSSYRKGLNKNLPIMYFSNTYSKIKKNLLFFISDEILV